MILTKGQESFMCIIFFFPLQQPYETGVFITTWQMKKLRPSKVERAAQGLPVDE